MSNLRTSGADVTYEKYSDVPIAPIKGQTLAKHVNLFTQLNRIESENSFNRDDLSNQHQHEYTVDIKQVH